MEILINSENGGCLRHTERNTVNIDVDISDEVTWRPLSDDILLFSEGTTRISKLFYFTLFQIFSAAMICPRFLSNNNVTELAFQNFKVPLHTQEYRKTQNKSRFVIHLCKEISRVV